MARVTPPERESVAMAALPVLGGVELMRADYLTQSFSRHVHEGYALGRIERGTLRFRYRGENLAAPAGSLNLVIPGEAHDGHGADAAGWSYRMFYLPAEALVRAATAFGERPRPPYFRMGVLEDPQLAARLGAVHVALEDPTASLLEKETRLLGLLAAWISRHAEDRPDFPKTRPERGAAQRARDRLLADLTRDPSLNELAREAHLSPFHLLRVFQREYGAPPHAYLNQARLDLARELLAGNDRLADVAAASGFADQSHLTRRFKSRYGVTPAKYRKIVQNS